MRTFILRARKAVTKPNFSLSNLPKAGRMEIVASCISNALWVANDVRDDTAIHIVLEGSPRPPLTLTFVGGAIAGLTVDEHGIAILIQKALKKAIKLKKGETKEVTPGVMVSTASFEEVVKRHKDRGALFYLHPKGKDIRKADMPEDVTFIFGDYIGMPSKSESFLDRQGAEKISLGPKAIFASQCITLVHNELDRKQKMHDKDYAVGTF